MAVHSLMGILIEKRRANAAKVQEVLTEHGCLIQVRLGLHEAGDACSEEGLMLLQLVDNQDGIDELYADLNVLEGVSAELIQLGRPDPEPFSGHS